MFFLVFRQNPYFDVENYILGDGSKNTPTSLRAGGHVALAMDPKTSKIYLFAFLEDE